MTKERKWSDACEMMWICFRQFKSQKPFSNCLKGCNTVILWTCQQRACTCYLRILGCETGREKSKAMLSVVGATFCPSVVVWSCCTLKAFINVLFIAPRWGNCTCCTAECAGFEERKCSFALIKVPRHPIRSYCITAGLCINVVTLFPDRVKRKLVLTVCMLVLWVSKHWCCSDGRLLPFCCS